MAVAINCRVQVKSPPIDVTDGLKEAVGSRYKFTQEQLTAAKDALLRIQSTAVSGLSQEVVAALIADGLSLQEIVEGAAQKLVAVGYDKLTEDQINQRKAILASKVPFANAYDTEVAKGQLIAKLPEDLAKYHKAILYVETGFNPAQVRCRHNDEKTKRNGCAGGMMGMGQIAKKFHTGPNSLKTNPNNYSVTQLEVVIPLNVEVSARIFMGNYKDAAKDIKKAMGKYKYPFPEKAADPEQAKADVVRYQALCRKAYRSLYTSDANTPWPE
jgi:hypothetical protein